VSGVVALAAVRQTRVSPQRGACRLVRSNSITHRAHSGGLWCEEDGFFYDVASREGHAPQFIRLKSFVGLISVFACLTVENKILDALPRFK
jgi:hypothetical protein